MTNEEEFPFVVARLWKPDQPVTWQNLNIYTYGSQVQFSNMGGAEWFKDYVDRNSRDLTPENPNRIYRINFEEVV